MKGAPSAKGPSSRARTPAQGSIPQQGHKGAQLRDYYSLNDDSRPVAIAEAGYADSYYQLPLLEEGQLAAVVALGALHETHGLRTQICGSTGAALHYNWLPRVLASLTCRFPEKPRVRY